MPVAQFLKGLAATIFPTLQCSAPLSLSYEHGKLGLIQILVG